MQAAYALTAGIRPNTKREPASEGALIEAIAQGDKTAMHTLFVIHKACVYRFVLRITRNPSLAEDLTSDVFLEVWRNAGQFKQRSQVSTWLLAIARFKAISAMRQRQDEELDEHALARIEDPTDNAEVALEKGERLALLRKCLMQMSPAHGEVIDLVYYHGKSVVEAGAIVGVSPATVKTRMFYARQRLGQLFQQAESARAPS